MVVWTLAWLREVTAQGRSLRSKLTRKDKHAPQKQGDFLAAAACCVPPNSGSRAPSSTCQVAAFGLGFWLSSMPAVRNFSLCACLAVLLDFLLQVLGWGTLVAGRHWE